MMKNAHRRDPTVQCVSDTNEFIFNGNFRQFFKASIKPSLNYALVSTKEMSKFFSIIVDLCESKNGLHESVSRRSIFSYLYILIKEIILRYMLVDRFVRQLHVKVVATINVAQFRCLCTFLIAV